MIAFENIGFAYGRQAVLRGVSARVPAGRYTALIGPNGSGKTTLLSILGGFLKPAQGAVFLDGKDIRLTPYRERACLFAFVQQRERIAMPFSCLEAVLMGTAPYLPRLGPPPAETLDFVERVMETAGVAHLMDKPVTKISGGELQRVLIARALAQRPRLLFLDEAMSDLDVNAKLSLLALLRRQTAEQGLTVLAVHHDLQTAYSASDEVIVLKEGTLCAQGAPEQTLTPRLFQDVFGVQAEIVPGKGPFFRAAMD